MFRSLSPFRARSEPTRAADPFAHLQGEMNRMFNDAFRGYVAYPGNGGADALAPSIDVKETDAAFEIEAELPGVDEKDIEVSFQNDVLTIKGEKKLEKEESKKGYHMSERSYGAFRRSFELPSGIDGSKVTAAYTKGVLKVTLPKAPQAPASVKKIAIKAA
ncbi:MAG: Hsp20/alpha crystallin family protein [Proteobacteria bacterium]|nr:Hsp20/alpha crystallin family protein [Pseudomonadota bacterium]